MELTTRPGPQPLYGPECRHHEKIWPGLGGLLFAGGIWGLACGEKGQYSRSSFVGARVWRRPGTSSRAWVAGGHCQVTTAGHTGAAPDVPEGPCSNVSSIFSQSFQHPLSSTNAACSFECVISRAVYLANFEAGEGSGGGLGICILI